MTMHSTFNVKAMLSNTHFNFLLTSNGIRMLEIENVLNHEIVTIDKSSAKFK